jgi:hypothetical protein
VATQQPHEETFYRRLSTEESKHVATQQLPEEKLFQRLLDPRHHPESDRGSRYGTTIMFAAASATDGVI